MTNIVHVWSLENTIVNYQDRLDSVQSMTKMREDNDMIYRTGLLYAEKKTKLSWLIWQGMTKTKHENDVTDRIGMVHSEIELKCHYRSDKKRSTIKSR